MRVIIIGAGLGGLTLAQGLHRAGIEAEVYERGPRDGGQPATYGIHVDGNGARALHACLSPQAWAAFDTGSAPAPDVLRFRDPSLKVLATRNREAAARQVAHRRAVRRQVLHEALLNGIDDERDGLVRFGHTFTRYRRRDDGRVEVFFDNGSSTVGDLVVGADGSNSRVRRQYLPHIQRKDLGILNIAGRLPASVASACGLPDDMLDGSIDNIVPAGPGWMFASTWRVPGEAEDYVVWAYAATRETYPLDIEKLDGTGLRRLVLDRLSGWDDRLRHTVAATPADTLSTVPLRSMPVLRAWPAGTVTLLGDAIHNMTPMAGIGANTALRDADTLCGALIRARDGELTVVGAVDLYERAMRAYANQALALSTRNARNAASTARVPRLLFRILLRVRGATPLGESGVRAR
ncbi:FAD-dependent oxidoreductase [Pseudonocardia spinosispora]|uniref:FAD-dependent oxidoreductase n=1 Tax=Pseudonocardia spinosispora TaxID=103441 RepID=UPI000422B646|nr:NAD(P)/FAD-dependent oxidoreductase [Pseudonocardia spinosispora]